MGTLKYDDASIDNSVPTADALAKAGYTIFGWDVEWEGEQGELKESPAEIAKEILGKCVGSRTPGHVVVLMHDRNHRKSRGQHEKLDKLIDILRDKVEFRTLDKYPGAP